MFKILNIEKHYLNIEEHLFYNTKQKCFYKVNDDGRTEYTITKADIYEIAFENKDNAIISFEKYSYFDKFAIALYNPHHKESIRISV